MSGDRALDCAGIRSRGFSLLELLAAIAVLAALAAVAAGTWRGLVARARAAHSMTNLRQLVAANYAYAADHGDRFCPTWDRSNRIRWHGGRASRSDPFDPERGFLGPYLGDPSVVHCPLFQDYVRRDDTSSESFASFEKGAGGYGYNDEYIGREPGIDTIVRMDFDGESIRLASLGNYVGRVGRSSRTVMFATTALARAEGIQEYPIAHPRRQVRSGGELGIVYQPSVHFRAQGKALVAWVDGRITAERPNGIDGPNYYGGDNKRDRIGWFGPTEDNGFWNPGYRIGGEDR